MGEVWAATDLSTEERVAIKRIPAGRGSTVELRAALLSLMELRHSNVVHIHDIEDRDEALFVVMELVDGEDLLTHLRASGASSRVLDEGSERRIRRAMGQLADGLHALHCAGYLHRDVKPRNVLVDAEGRVVLVDHGLVTLFGPDASGAVTLEASVGTVAYMAPEQARGEPIGPPADWYAVGTLLFEILSGSLPYMGPSQEVVRAKQDVPPPSPRQRNPEAPTDLSHLCESLLAWDPRDRPSGEEVLAALGIEGRSPVPIAHGLFRGRSGRHLASVEREAELQRLDAFLGGRRERPFRVMAVTGDLGAGKTTLLATCAESSPGLALFGTCRREDSRPYNAFADIVDRLSHSLAHGPDALPSTDDVAALVDMFPTLHRVPALHRHSTDEGPRPLPSELRRRGTRALGELIERIAEKREITFFIDAFEWADGDSRALMQELFGARRPPPCRLVLSFGTFGPASDAMAFVNAHLGRDVFVEEELQQLHLLPLDLERARALYQRLGGESPLPAKLEPDGRLPLALALAARGSIDLGELDGQDASPLASLLATRLEALPSGSREVLELLAVAGRPLAVEILADACQVEPRELLVAASESEKKGWLRLFEVEGVHRFELGHELIERALLRGLDPERERRLHLQLANALRAARREEVDPGSLIRHLIGAGEPHAAADLAIRAAQRLRRSLAFDRIADLYTIGLGLEEKDRERRRELMMAAAASLAYAGRRADAAGLYLAAAEEVPPGRQEALRLAAEEYLTIGDLERGGAILDRILEGVGIRVPRARFLLLLRVVLLEGRLRRRGPRLREQPLPMSSADLERLHAMELVARSIGFIDPPYGAYFIYRHALDSLEYARGSAAAYSLPMSAVALVATGRLSHEEVHGWFRLSKDLARKEPRTVGLWVESCQAMALAHTDFKAGVHAYRRAVEGYRRVSAGHPLELAFLHSAYMIHLRQQGWLDAHVEVAEELLGEARRHGDMVSESNVLCFSSGAWLVRDQPELLERELVRRPWRPPESGFHSQDLYALRAAVEIALYRGERRGLSSTYLPQISRARRSLLGFIEKYRAEMWLLIGKVSLAEASASPSPWLSLRRARSMARRVQNLGHPDYEVKALRLLAGAAALASDRVGAVRWLERLIVEAEALEMRGDAAAARMRLGQLLGGEEGADLRALASDALRFEGVVHLHRWVAMEMPGFFGEAERRGRLHSGEEGA